MTLRDAQALMSRAVEHSSAGNFAEAARCYRRLLKLRPADPLAHARLGRVLARMGKTQEALEHLARAYLEAPDEHDSRARLIEGLARAPGFGLGTWLRRALAALAADALVRHQRLVPAVAGLLGRQPPVAKVLRRIAAHSVLTRRDLGPELTRALSEPLVLRLLRDCVVNDPDLEALLTALRAEWLAAIVEGATLSWPDPELLAAIATQALTTEWAYAESSEERDRLARLATMLDDPGSRVAAGAPSRELLVYSLYRPLAGFADDLALLAMARADEDGVSELLHRHLIDPAREAELSAALPLLTAVADDVSNRVRAQYEERPYPCWRNLPRRAARLLGEVLAATLEDPALARSVAAPAPRVLVAGCGTGRHAIATATRFTGAQVLAVDLSLSSLGYAAHRAETLGIENIRFARADILGLGDLPDRFDVIECSGVLHHLADPEAGWQILRGLLAPGGFMRIGLYSERGRAVLDPIRALIAERGLEPTPEGIRATRAAVCALPEDAPARRICASPDFYALSGCRDMLFPVHEDRFSLPRIARALARLDLDFLGFELPEPRVRQLYRQRFPEDRMARDLANWDQLEAELPNLFVAMYSFWCRAGD